MYVIIGATGNTGSVVAMKLLEAGRKVRVLGRSAEKLQRFVEAGAEPFVCEVTDADRLSLALQGGTAVYAMIPFSVVADDFDAYQDSVSDAIASAIRKAGVKHAVMLSSMGADKSERTGPVLGLHSMELKLNRISGLNCLSVRAGYFMENTLVQIGLIRGLGIAGDSLRADVELPLVATRDIGAYAADALLRLNFTGNQTREVMGREFMPLSRATEIIGKAIGKPDLTYVQFPDAQARAAMLQLGMSPSVVSSILELANAVNTGLIRALEPRTADNTTGTTFQAFVTEVFLPAYHAAANAHNQQ